MITPVTELHVFMLSYHLHSKCWGADGREACGSDRWRASPGSCRPFTITSPAAWREVTSSINTSAESSDPTSLAYTPWTGGPAHNTATNLAKVCVPSARRAGPALEAHSTGRVLPTRRAPGSQAPSTRAPEPCCPACRRSSWCLVASQFAPAFRQSCFVNVSVPGCQAPLVKPCADKAPLRTC